MNYITDTDIDKISGQTGEMLRAQEKVEVMIPPLADGSNRPWEGGLNGHFFRIKRNEPVLVPRSIAELIRENEVATILSQHCVREYKRGNGKKLSQ